MKMLHHLAIKKNYYISVTFTGDRCYLDYPLGLLGHLIYRKTSYLPFILQITVASNGYSCIILSSVLIYSVRLYLITKRIIY